jgi:hypothetical protein
METAFDQKPAGLTINELVMELQQAGVPEALVQCMVQCMVRVGLEEGTFVKEGELVKLSEGALLED